VPAVVTLPRFARTAPCTFDTFTLREIDLASTATPLGTVMVWSTETPSLLLRLK
jgi:hypothetical protein